MRKLAYLFLPALFIACGEAEETSEEIQEEVVETVEEEVEEKNERKSPRTTLEVESNGVSLKMVYGSPRVKDRKIWGNLVPYGKVWRAGADETTAITFDQDVLVNGNEVNAGTYAFFIIPNENEDWEVILNEEWSKELHDVWGAYNYKQDKDVLRFKVSPSDNTDVVENLTYQFENGEMTFEWENKRFAFTVAPAQAV